MLTKPQSVEKESSSYPIQITISREWVWTHLFIDFHPAGVVPITITDSFGLRHKKKFFFIQKQILILLCIKKDEERKTKIQTYSTNSWHLFVSFLLRRNIFYPCVDKGEETFFLILDAQLKFSSHESFFKNGIYIK